MKVFIPTNVYNYDLTDATRFGDIVVVNKGVVDIFNIQRMRENIQEVLKDATEDDFVAALGAPIVVALVTSYMMLRFNKVNLLVFNSKKRKYDQRTVTRKELWREDYRGNENN